MKAFSSSNHILFIFISIFISSSLFSISSSSSSSEQKPYQNVNTHFIRTSCDSTTYPRLCFASLSKHAATIQTDHLLLTGTALNVTLASAKATSAMMSALSKNHGNGIKPSEAAAMSDCIEMLGDSVDELRKSISAMSQLRDSSSSNIEVTMSDVQTWVSAALTDESTCTDGFQEVNNSNVNLKNAVRSRIVIVSQLTSNALAFINQLSASSHA